jgi:hypothetical protein
VTPIAARTALASVATSCPATPTVPPSAFINVVSTFTVVVLPRPVRTEQGEDCAGLNNQINAVQHGLVPEGFSQPGNLNR